MYGAHNYRDILAGLLILVLGVAVAVYASSHYSVGSVNRMGPGFYPTVLGICLAGMGVVIAVPAVFEASHPVEVHWRSLAGVIIGLLLFAATLRTAGMVPAVVLLTAAAVLADNKVGLAGTVALAVGLAVTTYLIFVAGLGIVLHPFRNPF